MRSLSENLKHILIWLWIKLMCLYNSFRSSLFCLFQNLLFRINPFWAHFSYLFILSSFGFFALKSSNSKSKKKIKDFDVFFTSVSSVTSSSMSTIEMEAFSNAQNVVLTILMFCGGEIFMSLLGLHFRRYKIKHKKLSRLILLDMAKVHESSTTTSDSNSSPNKDVHRNQIELVVVPNMTGNLECVEKNSSNSKNEGSEAYYSLKSNSLKVLSNIVTCYLLVVHAMGSALIYIYLSLVPNAWRTLKQKGLSVQTFSIFTIASTLANCGFLPTNENAMVFKKNPGLLLILIPQILMGNTFFPIFLRLVIQLMEKFKNRDEFGYLLKNSRELGYGHLFPGTRSLFLGITMSGLVLVPFVMFCVLEWNSEAAYGLSAYEKLVACLFQVVNARHAGESAFDLSEISPAMLIIFVVMMYLPSYTSFLPIEMQDENQVASISEGKHKSMKTHGYWEHIIFSQMSYLIIFIILICITEREKIRRDPLNFNFFNIVLEIISAYGNVGFSVGYSCERQINRDGFCEDAWTGFVGRWSKKGKFILIVVMFFGKLKKFNLRGGQSWIIS